MMGFDIWLDMLFIANRKSVTDIEEPRGTSFS
jgi:uncharacterized membrane protein (UPF0127 family)